MKFFVILALAIGPAASLLAADGAAVNEADFTASPLPAGYKLKRADVPGGASAAGQPEAAKPAVYACVNDKSKSRIVVSITKLARPTDDDKKSYVSGFIDGIGEPLTKAGFKLASNDGVDLDKADFSKPYGANLAYENGASGKKLFFTIRVSFSDSAQVSTVISTADKSALKPLLEWVDSIKVK